MIEKKFGVQQAIFSELDVDSSGCYRRHRKVKYVHKIKYISCKFSYLCLSLFMLENLSCQCFYCFSLVLLISQYRINPLKPELNPICYLLALLGAHHYLHVSRIRVKLLTFRRLMSYIYIYIWSTHS